MFQENSRVIVMTTKEVERGKVKTDGQSGLKRGHGRTVGLYYDKNGRR